MFNQSHTVSFSPHQLKGNDQDQLSIKNGKQNHIVIDKDVITTIQGGIDYDY